MANSHTWNVFKRFRAGIFAVQGLLSLTLSIVNLVMLVNGWAVYDSPQKAIIALLLVLNFTSAILLVLMTIFRFRPLADFAVVLVLLFFQIGGTIAFTLCVPILPCFKTATSEACKALDSTALYGGCVSCALLCIFILVLIPVLRQPQMPPPPPPVNFETKYKPFDKEAASISTYYSWDRVPEKGRQSIGSVYSTTSYADSYYFKLQARTNSVSPRPSPGPNFPSKIALKHPLNQGMTPESALMDLSERNSNGMPSLRPFTPMLPGSRSAASISIYSTSSLDSRRTSVASWLKEPRPAVLASSKRSLKQARRTRSDDSTTFLLSSSGQSEPKPVSSFPRFTPVDKNLIDIKPLTISKPSTSKGELINVSDNPPKRKRTPQKLSLDNQLQSLRDSGTFSAVPRSPSPIGPYSPHSPFPPTPNSGLLPTHPRLTMHFRELKLSGKYRAQS